MFEFLRRVNIIMDFDKRDEMNSEQGKFSFEEFSQENSEGNEVPEDALQTEEEISFFENYKRNTEEDSSEMAEENKTEEEETASAEDTFEDISNQVNEDLPQENPTEKPKKSKKKIIIILSIIAVVLIALSAAFVYCSKKWKSGDMKMPSLIASTGLYQGENFVFFDGVSVNGTSLKGKTVKQAKKLIEEKAKEDNGKFLITVSFEDKSVEIGKDEIAYSLLSDDVLKTAKQFCVDVMRGKKKKQKQDYIAEITLSEDSKKAIIEKAAAVIRKDPVDATFGKSESGGYGFTQEKNGYELNGDQLVSVLAAVVKDKQFNAAITAEVTPTSPKITRADLEKNVMLLGEYTTTSTNNANGNSNMAKALSMCQGSVINPGETWSFNAHTGNSNNASAGWKEAGVYSNGLVTTGIGGGICQASTTIYNAALLSDMQVVERYPHTWAAAYAPAGLDAAINYPSADLKLKNATNYPMYFDCYMTGKTLVCKIYGCKSWDYDSIKLSASTTSTVAGSHKTCVASRSYIKNGAVVKTESLPSSRYSLKPKQSPQEAAAAAAAAQQQNNSSAPEQSSTPAPTPEPAPQPQPDPSGEQQQ